MSRWRSRPVFRLYDRQRRRSSAAHYEHLRPPADLTTQVPALSIEVRRSSTCTGLRPWSGCCISGVTPAAVSLLLIHLKKGGFGGLLVAAAEAA